MCHTHTFLSLGRRYLFFVLRLYSESLFAPNTMWVWGIEPRCLAWRQVSLLTELSLKTPPLHSTPRPDPSYWTRGRCDGIEPSQAPWSTHSLFPAPFWSHLEVELRLQGLDRGKPPWNDALSSVAFPRTGSAQTRSFLGVTAGSTLALGFLASL